MKPLRLLSLAAALVVPCAAVPAAHAQCSRLLNDSGVSSTENNGRYYFYFSVAPKGANAVDFTAKTVNFPTDVAIRLSQRTRANGAVRAPAAPTRVPFGDSRNDGVQGKYRVVFDHPSGSGPIVVITDCVEAVPPKTHGSSGAPM